MSNYDGIDRLSPGDEDLLAHDARQLQRRRDGLPMNDAPNCWGCPNRCTNSRCEIRLDRLADETRDEVAFDERAAS